MANVHRLARNTQVDISADNATWFKLPGRVDTAPNIVPTKVDSSDYDTNGFVGYEITMQAWTIVVKYNKLSNSGVIDATQELVRARQGQFGDSARLYVRWYDTDGGAEAWTGRAIVELQRSKTGVADLSEMTVTLTGDGALTSITNPYSAALAPVLLSALPSGAGVGAQVTITGQYFTGVVPATGVKFGAVTATVTTVVSDSTIIAVMPAGSAGSAPVTVTNVTGVSNSLPYTRT